MSPATVRVFARAVARRQFSVSAAARQAQQKPASAQWGRLIAQRLGTMKYYVPAAAALLGWPLAGKALFDGRV
jgi:hypothetical protein